jgi:hypothetical protein
MDPARVRIECQPTRQPTKTGQKKKQFSPTASSCVVFFIPHIIT